MSLTTCGDGCGDVAVVVVLFHPDVDSIAHVRQQAAAGRPIVAVSNGIESAQRDELRAMPGVVLVDNPGNAGLAKALNQGIDRSIAAGASFVVLLDQDSRLPAETINLLKNCAIRLRAEGRAVGCVAPRLVDKKAPTALVGAPGDPATVATSGSLLTREAIAQVGLMWEELFIDGIDHEWCFRARAKGFSVTLDPQATLVHHMGDAGVRIGNRYRPIHRSPFRHYHIVRNTLWLQRCRHIPLKWRMSELVKLAYRVPVYLAVSNDRIATLGALGRALVDGLGGPAHAPVVTA